MIIHISWWLFSSLSSFAILLLLLARLEANSRSLSTWVAVGDVQSSTSQLPSPQVFVFKPHQLTMIIFSTSTKCKKIVARHHRCIVDTIIITTNSIAINTYTIHPCNLSTTSPSQFYHHHHCQDKHQYDQYQYQHHHHHHYHHPYHQYHQQRPASNNIKHRQ